jgi:ABC-type Fe3+/spermidine/putrescine transport system ATPase subunit
MTTILEATDLRMRYPGGDVHALGSETAGVSFSVQRGELFALLGPSGCGKTTSLRILGGFTEPTAGRVVIDGEDVTDRPAHRRPVNTVFQSYALFPHLTIGGNVGFGLAMSKVPKGEIRARVAETLERVGLGGWERRKVNELSGGQAQRCALARALINRPSVLLLDEPLGALDLKLRRQMQDELVNLKSASDIGFVHVTHDQEEACAIADRIAVMDAGFIVQLDTPEQLYRRPRTAYVASFINAGSVVRGAARRDHDVFEIAHPALAVSGPAPTDLNGASRFAAVLRPGAVRVSAAGGETGSPGADGTVLRTTFTGESFDCTVTISEGLEIRASIAVADAAAGALPAAGDQVRLTWRPEDVIFVADDATDHPDPTSEERLP